MFLGRILNLTRSAIVRLLGDLCEDPGMKSVGVLLQKGHAWWRNYIRTHVEAGVAAEWTQREILEGGVRLLKGMDNFRQSQLVVDPIIEFGYSEPQRVIEWADGTRNYVHGEDIADAF